MATTVITPTSRVRKYLNEYGVNKATLADLNGVDERLKAVKKHGAAADADKNFKSEKFSTLESQYAAYKSIDTFIARRKKLAAKNDDAEDLEKLKNDIGEFVKTVSAEKHYAARVKKQFTVETLMDETKATKLRDSLLEGNANIKDLDKRKELIRDRIQFNATAAAAVCLACDTMVLEFFNTTVDVAKAMNKKTLQLNYLAGSSSAGPLSALYRNLPHYLALQARERRRAATLPEGTTFEQSEVDAGHASIVQVKGKGVHLWKNIDTFENNDHVKDYNFKSFVKKLFKDSEHSKSYNISSELTVFISYMLVEYVQTLVPLIQALHKSTGKKCKSVNSDLVAMFVEMAFIYAGNELTAEQTALVEKVRTAK